MEKNMYPQVPAFGNDPELPPSYNQAVQPPQQPSAPVAPIPMAMPMPAGQPHAQPFAQPQAVYVQSVPQLPPLGPRPCLVTCPSCHQQQMSKIRYNTSTKTHLFAAVFCVLGLFCCVCVPYCMDSCKNRNHYCSNCDAYLGMYK